MPFSEVMLDLETMGTAKDAAIISIGAVRFDPKEGKLGSTFYRIVNLKSALRAGGKIDADTVIWWLSQSDNARKALAGNDSVLIDTALNEFAVWIREESLGGIWGNGSDFDNVILEGAYIRAGKTPPWSYKTNRCYRTIAALNPDIKREIYRNIEATHHNALDDAITQAKHLCACFIK